MEANPQPAINLSPRGRAIALAIILFVSVGSIVAAIVGTKSNLDEIHRLEPALSQTYGRTITVDDRGRNMRKYSGLSTFQIDGASYQCQLTDRSPEHPRLQCTGLTLVPLVDRVG